MSTRKPDRFERVVKRDYECNHVNPERYDGSWEKAAILLLRREHAAVVRKVTQMRRSFAGDSRKGFAPYKSGYLAACGYLLAWLKARKGGV